jgi:hypothetical protein
MNPHKPVTQFQQFGFARLGYTNLASRQDLKPSTLEWMVATEDGYFDGLFERKYLVCDTRRFRLLQ